MLARDPVSARDPARVLVLDPRPVNYRTSWTFLPRVLVRQRGRATWQVPSPEVQLGVPPLNSCEVVVRSLEPYRD